MLQATLMGRNVFGHRIWTPRRSDSRPTSVILLLPMTGAVLD
jgi:hypothetical protein